MINQSRKLFYVVEAMLIIAYNSGEKAVSSKEIAKMQGLPPRYLEQLMQRLVRDGLLRGMRGPRGGYVLAKERRRITVADICKALGEEKEEEHKGYKATQFGQKIIKPLWEKIDGVVLDSFKEINLADLCEDAQSRSIRKNSQEKTDFII